jgi:hypothetical protein
VPRPRLSLCTLDFLVFRLSIGGVSPENLLFGVAFWGVAAGGGAGFFSWREFLLDIVSSFIASFSPCGKTKVAGISGQ